MSKKEIERKQREEQEAAAHVFQDFITTFQNTSTPPKKTFVKSCVLFAEQTLSDSNCGEIYNPKPIISQKSTTIKNAIECARILKDTKIDKSKKHDRPKSNLELLKEELKQRHKVRDERGKEKHEISQICYADGGDPNSTNLFVANLSSRVTENDLMLLFGQYGPLASVKIMWPRGDEKSRNSNCGFVAFMSRKDAERALNNLKHRDDMRVGWGKFVEVPSHPIYIPQDLLKLYLPPPPTGLPFNAQPLDPNYKQPENEKELNDLLKNSVIKVTIPFDKKVLVTVNRMVEFVVREGPMFEAMIMNRELRNSDYSFLFDYQCPVHVYYRWKLFSVLNGDSAKNWNMEPFRMFKNGPIWIPPSIPNYTEGMPDHLFKTDDSFDKTQLSSAQSNRLIEILKNLTMTKSKIAEGMVFCLNHEIAINDSVKLIIESLSGETTKAPKQIARLYLLSDVIKNCLMKNIKLKIINEDVQDMFAVFENLHRTVGKISIHVDRDNFKLRILKIINFWSTFNIFPCNFLKHAESYFVNSNSTHNLINDDDDNSSADEPLDGANLLKRSLRNKADDCVITNPTANDAKMTHNFGSDAFIASKWDTVDPEELQAQAMSTEKLYYMELENNSNKTNIEKNQSPQTIYSKWDSDGEVKKHKEDRKHRRDKKKKGRKN